MSAVLLSKAQFDAKLPQLEALTRDWAERESTSFDVAVRKAAGIDDGGGSIWDMPAIDSKRTVSLLVELEPVLGCSLPSSLIKRGGYATREELIDHLLPRIRQRCTDSPSQLVAASAAAESVAAASKPPSLKVLP